MEIILIALMLLAVTLLALLLIRKPAAANGADAAAAQARAEAAQAQLATTQADSVALQTKVQGFMRTTAQLEEREATAQAAKNEALAKAEEATGKATAFERAAIQTQGNIQRLETELALLTKQLADKAAEATQHLDTNQTLRQDNNRLITAQAELKGQHDGLGKQMQERTDEILKARTELQEQFRVSVNELMDKKSRELKDDNNQSVTELLKPVKERLLEFSTRVEDLNKQSAEQHGNLKTELGNMQQLNQALTKEAHNLSEALRGNAKVMGDWGEVTLERVLQAAGLSEKMYTKQDVLPSLSGEEGVLRSDFLIRLPDDRFIVIDSKVSLKSYVDYSAAQSEAERDQAAKDLLYSLQAHIQKLAESEYHTRVNSPEFTFMFVPHDPIFNLAVQKDPNLVSKAYQKKVLMVTPSTLVVALKVVTDLWQRDTMAKNQVRLAELAGEIYNKLSDGLKNLSKVGDNLETAQKSYSEAMRHLTVGRGNLITKAEEIKRLASRRVKVTKSLETSVPKLYAEAMETDDSIDYADDDEVSSLEADSELDTQANREANLEPNLEANLEPKRDANSQADIFA